MLESLACFSQFLSSSPLLVKLLGCVVHRAILMLHEVVAVTDSDLNTVILRVLPLMLLSHSLIVICK
jgi:hypothetical protein